MTSTYYAKGYVISRREDGWWYITVDNRTVARARLLRIARTMVDVFADHGEPA